MQIRRKKRIVVRRRRNIKKVNLRKTQKDDVEEVEVKKTVENVIVQDLLIEKKEDVAHQLLIERKLGEMILTMEIAHEDIETMTVITGVGKSFISLLCLF